ncbi:hypothetical protein PVAP13_8KG324766 [Panicum virgatum]|uniref:Uncharacterized protein n=1 Tax=Panicum virgatum TaxID=38727 RepID=A0A8T0PQ03_PANVG|nr:hypothetical protein PVAP13_8KG324766 [Panicum virgatum]
MVTEGAITAGSTTGSVDPLRNKKNYPRGCSASTPHRCAARSHAEDEGRRGGDGGRPHASAAAAAAAPTRAPSSHTGPRTPARGSGHWWLSTRTPARGGRGRAPTAARSRPPVVGRHPAVELPRWPAVELPLRRSSSHGRLRSSSRGGRSEARGYGPPAVELPRRARAELPTAGERREGRGKERRGIGAVAGGELHCGGGGGKKGRGEKKRGSVGGEEKVRERGGKFKGEGRGRGNI